VALHEAVPAGSRDLSREAIARIDLGIALAELGVPDEAIGQGRLALASRVVGSVRSRAADLDMVLAVRYPRLPAAREFHEAVRHPRGSNAMRAVRPRKVPFWIQVTETAPDPGAS